MAHVLCDESFAMSIAYFQKVGRTDVVAYWIAAVFGVLIPWPVGTAIGALAGGAILDPSRLGLDVVFPAAMAGLAVGLVDGRRELVAAASGAVVGAGVALLLGPAPGIVAGGLVGPAIGLTVTDRSARRTPESVTVGAAPEVDEGALVVDLPPHHPQGRE